MIFFGINLPNNILFDMSEKPIQKKNKTIHISPSTHDEAKKITKENGWNLGVYCDKAIAEKNKNTKKK